MIRPGPRAPGGRRRGLVLLLCGTLCSACGPRLVRETVLERENLRVELRRMEPPPSGAVTHDQPVVVADVRIAHILASLTHEDSRGRRHPTLRSEVVYGLAEGIARAASRATPADEIAAATFISDRRLLVFTSERVTAFRAFFEKNDLVIEFYAIEEPRRKDVRTQDYAIPVEIPRWKPGFTLVAGEAQELEGVRRVRVDWRDPYYARPVNLRARGGKLHRRTILMEADEPEVEIPARPAHLDDAQTRALDQIEAARRSGIITESEFRRRRSLVLEGRLEEAGYDPEPAP